MNERKFAELLIKVAEKQELTELEAQALAQKAGEIQQELQEFDNEYIPDSENIVVQVSKNSLGELEVKSLGKKGFPKQQETKERTKQEWNNRFTVRALQEVEDTSGKKHKVEAFYFQPGLSIEEMRELLKPFNLENEHEEGLHSLVTETFSFEQAQELKSYLENEHEEAEVFIKNALVPELGFCGEAFMSEHSSMVVTFEVNKENREGLSFPVYMNFVKPEVEAEREQYEQKLKLQHKEQLINAIVSHLHKLNKSELEVLVKVLSIEVVLF